MRIILFLSICAINVSAMTLDEYMGLVLKKNRLVNSYEISIEASKEKMVAGDLILAPILTAGYSMASDKSEPSAVADKRSTNTASLGLAKKFSTGTSVTLSAQTLKYEYDIPVVSGNIGYSTGGLGLSLQQSLWKDFLGHATRLRQDRESMTNKLENFGFELQKRITLIQTESDFWDCLVAQEDLKLKQDNFERAKKLDSWTSNRVNNGISDQSDLLQVRALANLRGLELATAKVALKSRETKIKENIDFSQSDSIPELTANLTDTRSYVSDLAKKKNIVKLDTYLTSLEAEVKQKVSEEVVDSLRPDLALLGKYNTSSYNTDNSEMQKNISKTDRPITFVGVSLSWLFGSDAKNSQLLSAKKDALASSYRAEQAKISSENSWQEHLRQYELIKGNVLTLEKIAQLQRDRAKSEQVKFTKGRTITSNVVNAETDAAQAEVNYLTAKSGLRKLEASTQLFISISE